MTLYMCNFFFFCPYFPCHVHVHVMCVCLYVCVHVRTRTCTCIYVAIGVDLGRPVKISLSPTLCKHLLSLTTEARKVLSLHYWTTTTAARQSTSKYENDKEKDVCLSRLQAHEQAHTSEPPKASLDSLPQSTGTTAHMCSSVPSPSSPSKEPPSSSLPPSPLSSFPAAYTCTAASNSSCHFEFPTLNVSTDQVVVELSLPPPPPPPPPVPPFLSHLSSPSCPLKAESDLKPSSVFLTPTVAMGRSSPKLVDEEEEEEGGGGGGRREGEGGSDGLDEGLILSWQCCSGLYPNAEGTSYIHVLTYTLHTYACCVTVFCHVVTS